jgi:hypothetical protein
MSRTNTINTGAFVGSIFITGLLVMLTYGVFRWVGIDPGSVSNWVVGLLVLWWLVIVVRLPWDLYFTTRGLLLDTQQSKQKGMNVSADDVAYVQRWAKMSLILAIGLHLMTGLGLALLQYFGVSSLGYYGSVAALLLMGFRPAGRAYDYLASRLKHIGDEILFPRDDVHLLKNKIQKLEDKIKSLEDRLDLEEEDSWAAKLTQDNMQRDKNLDELHLALTEFQENNKDEHQFLAQQAAAAAEKIAGGAQVVNHGRELVRFLKDA